MCNTHQKRIGKLYGIGIGPGDPKLLTIKAKEILDRVDTIFIPKGDKVGISCARAIVKSTISSSKNFVELIFPMTKDKKRLAIYWQKIATRIAKEIKKNRTAAFVTLGDPFVYSTYIYLFNALNKYFPDIDVETVPGICAFNAAASKAKLSLVEGDQKLAVLSVTANLRGLKEAFREFDTVVVMKIGSKLDKVIRLLKKIGLINYSILISHVGQPNERIVRDISSLKDKKLGYLSVIIVKPR